MLIDTDRFGSFDTKDSKIIEFPLGIPGFEDLRKFIILEVGDTKPVYWLQSTENKYIALPVIISFEILDNYNIDVRENELEELYVESKNDLLIINVVVIPSEVEKMTVNLAAPIIINAKRGIGKQIIIDAKELPIRFPVYDAVMKSINGGEKNAGSI
ncbi:MAG: flagellar assembly protein FliW [Eubacteriales bacterium]|nr:flagellar assembly protein FliW [Eubacteriales bacterium]